MAKDMRIFLDVFVRQLDTPLHQPIEKVLMLALSKAREQILGDRRLQRE
jgi:hypothetical protein